MMPNMDGYAAAQALLGSLALPPPIIFLTAKSDRADIERLSRIASGIISKPFEPRQLCAQIDAILAAWRERGA
jgi:two-component system catabolic regulation response regulator CreB